MIDLFIVPVNVYDFPVHFRYGKVVWFFFLLVQLATFFFFPWQLNYLNFPFR
jgi:hypothetical protein